MRLAISCFVLAGTLAAQSAVTLTDRNVIFQYSSYPTATNSTGGGSVFAANGTNHVPTTWWYYHVSGDATGSAFNSAGNQFTTAVSADRRTGTLEWSNVDSRGFAARLVTTIYSTSTLSGIATHWMTITNTGTSPLTLTVYAYADVDVNAISSDDSAFQMTGLPAGQTRVTDPGLNVVNFMGNGYGRWQAGLWPTLRDTILTTAHTLTDSGLPVMTMDYAGAFSWTVTLAPNASASMHNLLAIDGVPRSTNVAMATPFGAAKPGTPGLPEWTLNRPFAGTVTGLQITNGVAGAAPIALIGTQTINFPLPPIGTVYVVPVTTFSMPAFSAMGVSTVNLTIPIAGTVHFQAIWADAGAAGGFAHTGGLTWQIGSF
jgi:hypothetical protein